MTGSSQARTSTLTVATLVAFAVNSVLARVALLRPTIDAASFTIRRPVPGSRDGKKRPSHRRHAKPITMPGPTVGWSRVNFSASSPYRRADGRSESMMLVNVCDQFLGSCSAPLSLLPLAHKNVFDRVYV